MRLTPGEIALYCERLSLSNQARVVLEQIRSSPPSRRVGSGGRNVPVRYQSRKMGLTIQAESRTVEFAGAYVMEHDAEVFEFWDQPPSISLHYPVKLKNGHTRTIGVLHTPDYFVIRKDALGWEEWKTEADLLRFESRESARYVRDGSGRWRCPPGEAVAAPLGFYYRVRSSAEIHEVFQRNLRFLSYYLREETKVVSEDARKEILACIKSEPGITLKTLLGEIQVATSDVIYTLLAQEALYVDVYAAPLAEPERVHLFSDEETAHAWAAMLTSPSQEFSDSSRSISLQAGSPLVWDGRPWTILNTGARAVAMLAPDGTLIEVPNDRFLALVSQGKLTGLIKQAESESLSGVVRERIANASKEALQEAKRRYSLIQPMLEGQAKTERNTSEGRAMRRWIASYRAASHICGCGYIGLLPNYQKSGNRQPRFSEKTTALLHEFINKEYENHKQKNKREVYGEFINACHAQGLTSVPSYKTFAAAINHRPRYEQVKKRKGPRAAYAHEPLYWELTWTLPRHGDRPFEVVHIDHTELDVEVVDSRTGRETSRPWVTFMVDAFSRRLLSVYLTFDPPSYRSCMMVIRECVRRHNRLPELVVVDWGPEFESVYFETLLARYECNKATRPKAKPRFGSVCERLFNTANTTFIHNLAGNTQVMKNVRQVTKSVNPRTHAVWTLGELYAALRCWAYEVYDNCCHQTLSQTPKEVFEMGLLQSGFRDQQLITYDDDFIFFTLPTTRKETAKLLPLRGVKINHLYYWAKDDAFLDHPELEKKQLPVRYDPYDMGHAYVTINGKSVECISEHYAAFKGRTERELAIAMEELRRRNRQHSQRFTLTAAKLARFITSVEACEVLLTQQSRDEDAKTIFALMEGKPLGESKDDARNPRPLTQEETTKAPVVSVRESTETGRSGDDDIYDDF
jgi:transposase InsO family protein